MSKVSPLARKAGAFVAAGLAIALCMCSTTTVSRGENANAALSAATTQEENAVPKTEVIYAKLDSAGALENTYVVNTLEPERAGTLCDYGNYESVQNLTNSSELGISGQAVFIDIAEGQENEPFSYQANLGSTALPWNVSVRYYLNGKLTDASGLAGASGSLTTQISIAQNTSIQDTSFFENYLVTATATLASNVARNIEAPDAQIALSCSDTHLTFMVMPGKEKTVSFTADVTHFEMNSIQIAAIPFSIAFDFPDTNSLIAQFSQLTSATATLANAAETLASGADSLSSGLSSLQSGAAELTQGSESIYQGLCAYQQGILNQAAQLQEAANALGSEDEVSAQYEQAVQDYLSTFVQAFTQSYAQGYGVVYAQSYAQAYQQAREEGADEQSAASQATQQASYAATETATNTALAAATQAAESLSSAMQQAVRTLATRAAFVASAESLQGSAAGLGSATSQESLIGGAASLALGSGQFTQGMGDAASGASAYAEGTQEFSQGMSAFETETSSLPSTVQTEIDALMATYDKSSFEAHSFVSSKNTNVKLVQFVMSTPEIVPTETASSVNEEQEEETPLDRLLALFR